MNESSFEWDENKEVINIIKHHIDFISAQEAFFDPYRVIATDESHSHSEDRHFCIRLTDRGVLTVRFVYRNSKIRIFGAGYWRKGKKLYEKENK